MAGNLVGAWVGAEAQLTMVVATSLIAARGGFDPADLSRRLVEWLPTGAPSTALAFEGPRCPRDFPGDGGA